MMKIMIKSFQAQVYILLSYIGTQVSWKQSRTAKRLFIAIMSALLNISNAWIFEKGVYKMNLLKTTSASQNCNWAD